MSFARLFLAAALLSMAPLAAHAQTGRASTVEVTGSVHDAGDQEPLTGATILLVRDTPDSLRVGGAAGADGSFALRAVSGTYRMRVTFVGYLPLVRTVEVTRTRLDLGILELAVDRDALDEVVVETLRRRVEVRGDTTAFSADAFATNPDADAQDLLSKLPGVVIADGQVTAEGEAVQRVLVDGREFFGTDVQAALRSLPADIVQEIQVFDRQSDASRFSGFDDGTTEKTVNIVTRPDARNGSFGRVFVGGGAEGEYLAGGNVSILDGERRITLLGLTNNVDQQNFATEDLLGVVSSGGGRQRRGGGGGQRGGGGGRGGSADVSSLVVGDQSGVNSANALGVNYTDKLLGGALALTGSYFYNATDNTLASSLDRDYTTGDAVTQRYAQTDDAQSTNTNHRVALRAEYSASSRTQIVVQPRLTFQDNTSTGTLLGATTLPSGAAVAATRVTDEADGSALSASGSLLVRHRLEAPGRTITLSVDGQVNDRQDDSQLATSLFDADSDAPRITTQLFDTDALSRGVSARLGFTEPLGESGQLQFNYRPSIEWTSSDRLAFLGDGSGAFTVLDSAQTNQLDQRSITQSGGIAYRMGDRQTSVQVGLDVQHERLESEQVLPLVTNVDRTFWSLLPSARLRVTLGEGARLNLDYRARTQTPSASQVQDVIDTTNPLQLTSGNPDLVPSTTHTLRARLNRTDTEGGTVLFGLLSGSYGVNTFASATTFAQTDTEIAPGIVLPAGGTFTQSQNVDGAWNVQALASYGRPFQFIRSNANLSLGTSYARLPGFSNGAETISNQFDIDGRAFVGSAISPRLDFSLEYAARYTQATSSTESLDDTYVRHLTGAKLTWLPWDGVVLSSDVSAIHYTGFASADVPTQILWGGRIGYKFLARDVAEINLTVSDLLDQQSDIDRTVTETYLQSSRSNALGRYVMLNLTYKLRTFGR